MTSERIAPLGLDDLAPTTVWVVHQLVEGYPALVWDGGEPGAWMACGLDREAGHAILMNDLVANGRVPELYRLDEIDMCEAFERAREIPTPVRFPGGATCPGVAGLALFRTNFDRVSVVETLPL